MNITKKYFLSIAILLLEGMLLTRPAYALEMGVFGDVNYVSAGEPGGTNFFGIGGLDLYSTQEIDDDTTAFFEVVFENDGSGFVVDVERYWLQRKFTNSFQVLAGRLHSPLGYWNRNFHHGKLNQDTPSRPGFLDFEDGSTAILPMHLVGIILTGYLGNGFAYELSVANSSAYDTSTSVVAGQGGGEILIGNVGDFSDDKTFSGLLTYIPRNTGLSLGLFVMANTIVEAAGTSFYPGFVAGDDLFDQTVVGVDINYETDTYSLLAEFHSIENEAMTGVGDGQSHDSEAFYVQLGVSPVENFKIIYRFESVDFDATDQYYILLNSNDFSGTNTPETSTRNVLAFRFTTADESNALTLEFINTQPDVTDSFNTTTLNWAFLMF